MDEWKNKKEDKEKHAMDGHEWAHKFTHNIHCLSLFDGFVFINYFINICVCLRDSWCVYNYAVIKLIYDEKTRDKVAGLTLSHK